MGLLRKRFFFEKSGGERGLRGAILANCGIQACFRTSREDAQILAKELLPTLYTQPPGWEFNIQNLHQLPLRHCFVKNKAEGGVVLIKTPEMPSPWQILAKAGGELNGIDEETFRKNVDRAHIGTKYLRDRKTIKRQYRQRLEKLTASPEPVSFREPKNRH